MEEKSIVINASVPSTSSYLHPTVSSGKIFIKNNFIKKGKVIPFHRPRFKELTLRGKTPFAILRSTGNFEWALLAGILSKGTSRLWFWKRSRGLFNSQQLQSYIEKEKERERKREDSKNCFVTRYRYASKMLGARHAFQENWTAMWWPTTCPRLYKLTYHLLRT